MDMQLTESQILILKAALFELNHAWKRGTANSGFQDKTMGWLRGPNTPWMHESQVETLLSFIDRPNVRVKVADTTGQ